MEQFSFKQGNATIRHLKEMPKPKKKINTDRVLFILLLGLVLGFGCYYVFNKVTFIEVDGMVTMNKLAVHFTDDVRILQLNVTEGTEVEQGDTLFYFRNPYFENDAAIRNSATQNRERLKREILTHNRTLSEKRTERDELISQMNAERLRLESIRRLVIQAAYTRSKLDDQQRHVDALSSRLRLVKEEIRFIIRHIDQLNRLNDQYASRSTFSASAEASRMYVAPVDGVIGRITVTDNEVCYKTEEVMTIHRPEQLRVQAYFRQEEMDKIELGSIVDVTFPDGKTEKGRIDRFYVSTYELPPEFQKKYEPTERSILVDIMPIDAENLEGWKQFYKMSVKVSLKRFF
ncbi:MAG: HlyD family efflux transporter periplasmic adaptor subunit [Bacteroidota bacterium]